jgi:hypothetical protein
LDENSVFRQIGTVEMNKNSDGVSNGIYFTFVDNSPQFGDNVYRIRAVSASGQSMYSNTVKLTMTPGDDQKFYILTNADGVSAKLVANSKSDGTGTIVMYNIVGATLNTKTVQLSKGVNIFDLPVSSSMKFSVQVVSLYINNQLIGSQKIIL